MNKGLKIMARNEKAILKLKNKTKMKIKNLL
jgi:hypothetical protein